MMLLFSIIFTFIFIVIGASKGICDAVSQYDSYKDYGYFWSGASWDDLYTHHTLIERIMNASFNAWHVFDWARLFSTILLVPTCVVIGKIGCDIQSLLIIITIGILCHQIAFIITHKRVSTFKDHFSLLWSNIKLWKF